MKKTITLCLAALLASPAFAELVVDGNLADWGVKKTSHATDWTPNAGILYTIEDQHPASPGFLEPGYGGQAYDAEALYATTQGGKLFIALATGHNPLTVNNPGANSYGAGDFAIDFGKDGSYELGIDIQHAVAGKSQNATPTQTLANIYKNPTWDYGLWKTNDPTFMKATGTLIGPAVLAFTTVGQNSFGQWGADKHFFYEISLDLDLLKNNGWDGHTAFNIHWTENCANDSIIVDPAFDVPEPAILGLMSLGLLGIVSSRRRMKPAPL